MSYDLFFLLLCWFVNHHECNNLSPLNSNSCKYYNIVSHCMCSSVTDCAKLCLASAAHHISRSGSNGSTFDLFCHRGKEPPLFASDQVIDCPLVAAAGNPACKQAWLPSLWFLSLSWGGFLTWKPSILFLAPDHLIDLYVCSFYDRTDCSSLIGADKSMCFDVATAWSNCFKRFTRLA